MWPPLRLFLDTFRTSDAWWGGKNDASELARAESFLGMLRRSRIVTVAAFLLFTVAVFVAPNFDLAWASEVALVHLALFLAILLFLAQPLQRLILHFELEARPLRRELSWSIPALLLLLLTTTALHTEIPGRSGLLIWVLATGGILAIVLHQFLRIGPSVGVLRVAAALVLTVPVARYALIATPAGLSPVRPETPLTERAWPVAEIATQPAGARVYLDWQLLGETPLRVEGMEGASQMVVVKNGYIARFRKISRSRPYYFDLVPEPEAVAGSAWRNTVLLRVFGADDESLSQHLEKALIARGLFPAPMDGGDFDRALASLGELDRADFLAWARSRFRADLMTAILLPKSRSTFVPVTRLLDGEAMAPVRKGLARTVVINLWNGRQVTSFSVEGSSSRPEQLAVALARQLERRLGAGARGDSS